MVVFLVCLGMFFSVFYYCQALKSGMGYKRWALAGFMFGPIAWPMFCMQKRMKICKKFGFDYLMLRA